MSEGGLACRGWEVFAYEDAIAVWARHALAVATQAIETTTDWRAGGTWAPGVDLLPNDGEGRLQGGPPLVVGGGEPLADHAAPQR